MKQIALVITGTALAACIGVSMARAEDGASVYKAQCAKCHGEDGKADTPVAKAMKAPALAGDAKVAAMSVADLTKSIKENKKHAPLAGKVTDDQFAAVAAHVKTLAGGK